MSGIVTEAEKPSRRLLQELRDDGYYLGDGERKRVMLILKHKRNRPKGRWVVSGRGNSINVRA